MKKLVSVARALGDETRMRALVAVKGRELCLCQITELLQLAPSTVSKHMSILKQAELIRARKEGRWMYYQWSGKDAPEEVRKALNWVRACIKQDEEAARDRKRLEGILKTDPEVLCRRQNRKC